MNGHVGDANPLAAVEDALHLMGFDEIILSTLPWRLSRWLRVDLPRKVRALGLPVLHVTAAEAARADAVSVSSVTAPTGAPARSVYARPRVPAVDRE